MMLKNYEDFYFSLNENSTYNNKNIIYEICVAMLLINNNFLDNILDKGLGIDRYKNSSTLMEDLKNLILSKNRLNLGKWNGEKFVKDEDLGKINSVFQGVEFSIDEDINKLINSRVCARNIIDKLLSDEKLTSDRIENIYWIGPNKIEGYDEDIVLELTDGIQYSFYLNKNVTAQKTSSFNKFGDDIIGPNMDTLFNEYYIDKWNKLIQQWVKIIYENSKKNMQLHIEKFIDVNRIESLTYFEYFNIKHKDDRYKILGEYIQEFDKNILKFSDLMTSIWKLGQNSFDDYPSAYKKWTETKLVILNSHILEHIFTTSLKADDKSKIKKLQSGYKLAVGNIKMKLIKTIVEKLQCTERSIYYLSNNGNNFFQLPSRKFFRDNYKDMRIKFDYHVRLVVDEEEEENNDFKFKVILKFKDKELLKMNILIKFSSDVSGKLSAKFKFDLPENLNYLLNGKIDVYE